MMMKTINIAVICVLTTFIDVSAFAQPPASGQVCTNITLTLKVATNVISIGSRFLMEALVTNSCSHIISIGDGEATSISLAATSGDVYRFSLERSDYDNLISHKRFDGIRPNSTYEWPLSFEIGGRINEKEIAPGTYALQAQCDYLGVGNEIYHMTSNPVAIKIE
jgi:hypothetical protein